MLVIPNKTWISFKSLGAALSISALNQVVASGTNFALNLYLVRALSPEQFGMYGIGFSVILFFSGLGNALFLVQMAVCAPDKLPHQRLLYEARMALVVFGFCAITIVLVCIFLALGSLLETRISSHTGFLIAITAASIAYLVKDFYVRQAFIERRESRALAINVVSSLTLLALILWVMNRREVTTSETGLWIYVLGQTAGFVGGMAIARLPLSAVRFRPLVDDLSEAWRGGRWAVGGTIVTWTQAQAYAYVTAFVIGVAAVGEANAARLLVAPFTVAVSAVIQVALPRLAFIRTVDSARMIRYGQWLTLVGTVMSLIYSFAIISMLDIIGPMVVGREYGHMTSTVAVWCLVLIAGMIRGGVAMTLQAMKEFRVLTLTHLVTALATIGMAAFLSKMIDVQGAIMAGAIGDLLLALWLWRYIWTSKNRNRSTCA